MGYLTNYTLAVEGPDQQCIDCAKRIGEVALGEMPEGSPDEVFQMIRDNDLKWYEWESDLKVVSAEFPDVLIHVDGAGGETGDIWKAWFKGGQHLGTWTVDCDPPELEKFLAAKDVQPRESGLVKTNIELATMIQRYLAADETLANLVNAADGVLAAEDDPESIEGRMDSIENRQKHMKGEVARAGSAVVEAEKLVTQARDDLGNMGVALGLVESQRDDAVKALVDASEIMADCGQRLANMHTLMSRELINFSQNLDLIISKCRAGETEPPALMLAPDGSPNDFFLVPGHNGCWVEVGDKVVYIRRDETRLIAQIYNDAREEPLSTAQATFGYKTQGQVGSDAPGQG